MKPSLSRLQEYDRLAPFFEKHYGTKLEQVNMSLKGWNWGLSRFTANALDFEVDGKTAFEIPLGNVSHSLTSKNEVTVEFHPNDDAPVSLMELRFHIPAGAADNEQDPVQDFYRNVIAKADIIQATGDAIVILQEIQCLTPRWGLLLSVSNRMKQRLFNLLKVTPAVI